METRRSLKADIVALDQVYETETASVLSFYDPESPDKER